MRNVYHVTYKEPYWHVVHAQQSLGNYALKETAVESAITIAKKNQPSQVVVHLKNGQIETEYTYGNDPYPPRG